MSITNSLPYCGDVEDKYNREYGWARMDRYGLPVWVKIRYIEYKNGITLSGEHKYVTIVASEYNEQFAVLWSPRGQV